MKIPPSELMRPQGRPFLSARWRNLVIVNYQVQPGLLAPYLPEETQLDSFKGKHYLSLVAFLFQSTKLGGVLPLFPFQTFEEINLRFYVKRDTGGRPRRGVVFIREIVPYPPIVWAANTLYKENYVAMPTRREWHHQGRHAQFTYHWGETTLENMVSAHVLGDPRETRPGSLEEFVLEHYWGYSGKPGANTREYRVWHPRWKVWKVRDSATRVDARVLYGADIAGAMSKPHSVMVAEGSEVEVYPGEKLGCDC